MKYTLTATLNDQTQTHEFEADNSLDAHMEAIAYIMDTAYADKKGPWAVGRITFVDEDGNEIAEPMESKE